MKQLLAIAALAVVAGMSAATDPLAGEPEGERIALWPEGKVPSIEEHQYNAPFIEWFVPSNKTTDAVMIVTCGGGYGICNWVPKGSMGGDFRDWLVGLRLRGKRHQEREVSGGGIPAEADPLRIHPVRRRAGADETDRPLRILPRRNVLCDHLRSRRPVMEPHNGHAFFEKPVTESR